MRSRKPRRASSAPPHGDQRGRGGARGCRCGSGNCRRQLRTTLSLDGSCGTGRAAGRCAAGTAIVILQPNAGSPRIQHGSTVYDATPEQMAATVSGRPLGCARSAVVVAPRPASRRHEPRAPRQGSWLRGLGITPDGNGAGHGRGILRPRPGRMTLRGSQSRVVVRGADSTPG